jgi:hypothetical protein
MTTKTYAVDEARCEEAEGNWQKVRDFAWFERPDDAEKWTLVYTHNREAMKRFLGRTAIKERHNHWAVGWVEGYAIRVYVKGTKRPTKAFETWCELQDRLSDYPILDEEDYSRREYEATRDNIQEVADRRFNRFAWHTELPEDHVQQLWDWFDENDQSAIEPRDGDGGYPCDEEMDAALVGLGWLIECAQCEEDLTEPHEHCRYCGGVYYEGQQTVHPVDSWEFCSIRCLSEGYSGERSGDHD